MHLSLVEVGAKVWAPALQPGQMGHHCHERVKSNTLLQHATDT